MRTSPLAAAGTARRYAVVILGRTTSVNLCVLPAGLGFPRSLHGTRLLCCCTTAPRAPRTTPVSFTFVPTGTARLGCGG
jgi:hypothetical protein